MNAYDVLGVLPGASIEQVKEAYRQKAVLLSQGNYSPDSLSGVAKAKMDELNQAYDEIMLSMSEQGSNNDNSDFRSVDYDASDKNNSYVQFGDIRAKINSGRYDDAEMLLDGVPKIKRNAEWYFLKGSVQHRRGWFDEASKNFNTAYAMDPSNDEYRQARDRCEYNRRGKFDNQFDNTGCCSCSPCSICSSLLIADCCCDCMRGC